MLGISLRFPHRLLFLLATVLLYTLKTCCCSSITIGRQYMRSDSEPSRPAPGARGRIGHRRPPLSSIHTQKTEHGVLSVDRRAQQVTSTTPRRRSPYNRWSTRGKMLAAKRRYEMADPVVHASSYETLRPPRTHMATCPIRNPPFLRSLSEPTGQSEGRWR